MHRTITRRCRPGGVNPTATAVTADREQALPLPCSFSSHHSVTPINQDYFGALLIYLVDYLGRLSEAFHRSEGRTQSQWQTRR
jgi:hypothetical protein